MIPITAARVAELTSARLIGDGAMLVGPGVSIDSREVSPGALFAAITGSNNDGHEYVSQAVAAGAAAVLVEREVFSELGELVPVPQLLVPDVVNALTALARAVVAAAKGNGLKVLALTGSSGKTTTKDMLAQVLEPLGATVSPPNSLNNATGMPLTALRVGADTEFLVSEMGASHVGEIANYVTVAPPDAAAVLNVGLAHLGEFGSRERIAQAKAELVNDLAPTSWAVLNFDDPLVAGMAANTPARIAGFSVLNTDTDLSGLELWVRIKDLDSDAYGRPNFTLYGKTPTESFEFPVQLRFLGAHLVADAAAAAALALAVGVSAADVATGLNAALPRSRWRMEPHLLRTGTLLLNDAYNANPLSVRAALAVIKDMKAKRLQTGAPVRVTAVLGDMLELGAESAALHQSVGRQAAAAGVDTLLAV
ncbi:MAG: UDP-N-acetylmuramoyl-tripeptide--D-alanyl-D-alanine ligase, partial [Propionibacteriaceae bacterium]|nr:UDP-N-acetylmuramoyl-tripeptide--D-alanyl-D-alanine ligase [Propionibacteriaceae bacterium]